MKISSMCFKRNLCSKASSRKPKMALSGKILGRLGAVPKNSWSCLHKMEIFLDLWLHLSFIFSFAGRTQWWFNFPKFKEHFFSQKEYCLVFCTEKLLILCRQLPNVVRDILISSLNQICWNIIHSTTAKLVFQIFVFDIILYFPTYSSSISCFFNQMMIKNTKIRWIIYNGSKSDLSIISVKHLIIQSNDLSICFQGCILI